MTICRKVVINFDILFCRNFEMKTTAILDASSLCVYLSCTMDFYN